jgi:CheY-like chemotaxis protein
MNETAVVLLIEENIDDLYAFERGLRNADIRNPVRIVRHAAEARCYLEGVGVYANRQEYPLPALIVMDLLLKPEGTALQLLTAMRRQPHLKDIPLVAVGRRSTRREDVQRVFDAGANAYLVKEQEMKEIVRLIQELELLKDVLQKELSP